MLSERLFTLVAVGSGALAGVLFRLKAWEVERVVRITIGALLGLTSIVLGYLFIYMYPVNVEGSLVSFADVMGFLQFWVLFTDPLDYVFIAGPVVAGAYTAGRKTLAEVAASYR